MSVGGYHPEIRLTVSILLVGSWMNMMLFSVELLLAVYLVLTCSFRASRIYLGFTLSLDTVCTAAVCAHVYYFVTGASMSPRLWTTPLMMVPTFLAGAMEQAFMVYRYRTLSGNKKISISLWSISVVHTIFAILGPSLSVFEPNRWDAVNITTTVAATLSCATNLLIASLMVRKLQTAPIIYDSTRSLIRRISLLAVMCGCTPALATMLMLITFLLNLDAYYFVLFCLGRVYTLTMLVNIMILRSMQLDGQQDTPGTAVNTIDFQNLTPELTQHGSLRRHVMSAPRTEIRSIALDPISKPHAHVPAFSIDSFLTTSRQSSRNSLSQETITEGVYGDSDNSITIERQGEFRGVGIQSVYSRE